MRRFVLGALMGALLYHRWVWTYLEDEVLLDPSDPRVVVVPPKLP